MTFESFDKNAYKWMIYIDLPRKLDTRQKIRFYNLFWRSWRDEKWRKFIIPA